MLKVLGNGALGGLADGDEPLAVALTRDEDGAEHGVVIAEPKGGDLAGAQAGGVEEFEHGAVAQVERGARW